jgi:hypothetical protein
MAATANVSFLGQVRAAQMDRLGVVTIGTSMGCVVTGALSGLTAILAHRSAKATSTDTDEGVALSCTTISLCAPSLDRSVY